MLRTKEIWNESKEKKVQCCSEKRKWLKQRGGKERHIDNRTSITHKHIPSHTHKC